MTEDQHVGIRKVAVGPHLPADLLAGFVDDGEAQTVQGHLRNLRQSVAEFGAVVVAVHPDQPVGPLLQLVQQPWRDPVAGVDDHVGISHLGP